MKKPTTRPPRTYDTPLQVLVTKEQRKAFGKAAAASGLTLSSWARERLLQAVKKDTQQN